MKCTEGRAVWWPEVWKFYRSLTLLHFLVGGANDAQNVSIDTARRKDVVVYYHYYYHNKQNL